MGLSLLTRKLEPRESPRDLSEKRDESLRLRNCRHCQNPILNRSKSGPSSEFCCSGCETVAALLKSRGLDGDYYRLLATAQGGGRPASSASVFPTQLTSQNPDRYLDDLEFVRLYADEGGRRMRFYLEGVHCAACVWLVEKLPEFSSAVATANLNLSDSVATIELKSATGFSQVAQEIRRLGYLPHPVKETEANGFRQAESRTSLIRIGVAAAATGNIMLLAIPLYAGLAAQESAISRVFQWASLVLFLPVLFYSAVPFYRSARSAIRMRTISIDIPIAAAIILGALASIYHLWIGSEHIYFDSLSALVFLLLGSRYLLRKAQQISLDHAGLLHFLTPHLVRKWNPETQESSETRIDLLREGDQVEVRVGEAIPVDGQVLHGTSMLNCGMLTGESNWVPVAVGDWVYAGTTNQQAPLVVKVAASGVETRLGKILKAAEAGAISRSPLVETADRISKYFVIAVVLLSLFGFYLGFLAGGFEGGLTRTLAMLIVTCPCALALATPLAMARGLGRAAKQGILIKNAGVLEKMAGIRELFLDKTGTVTSGTFEVLAWEWKLDSAVDSVAAQSEIQAAVLAIESKSAHPVGRALVQYLENKLLQRTGELPLTMKSVNERVDQIRETLGSGIGGRVAGHTYWMGRLPLAEVSESDKASPSSTTLIGVQRDGTWIAQVRLGDEVRADSRFVVQELQKAGIRTYLLTGDQRAAGVSVGKVIGIPEQYVFSAVSPEGKRAVILKHPHAAMVGDGANDAIALASAQVGIAVHGGMEVSLRSAEVYMQKSGVTPVLELLTIAHESMRVLRRNIVFSIFYNSLGVWAALTGHVGPLFAAILMPASAATVMASSLLGTSKLRHLKQGRTVA